MKTYSIVTVALLICISACQSSRKENKGVIQPEIVEQYRPVFHFTPGKNWINDPNGLVYYQGEYHLFYQYNPFGDTWGHMSWGHAVSENLIDWTHLPVALYEEDSIMIFSGSALVDQGNTSGLCGGEDCLMAIYTSHDHSQRKLQHQSIAYSNDQGRTWTKYGQNPVLDLGMRDFRDPKVFWHEENGYWVMVVSHPLEFKVQFYRSDDLKNWILMGEFGNRGDVSKIWECPDLLKVPVSGTDAFKWVLIISSGSQYEGFTGMQYFVGEFDGKTFVSDDDGRHPRWLDYGKDFYAAITYNNLPEGDPPVLIGWANNWAYANTLPTSPWRGMMAIPRELSLKEIHGDFTLIQKPIESLYRLAEDSDKKLFSNHIIKNDDRLLSDVNAGSFLLKIRFRNIDADTFGIEILKGEAGETVVGYDNSKKALYIDRTRSGKTAFHEEFASIEHAPLMLDDNTLELEVLVDQALVEVFAKEGSVVITDQVFPESGWDAMQLFAEGGETSMELLEAFIIR